MFFILLVFLQHPLFQPIDECIQSHCHDTEKYDTHKKPVELEHLTRIDNQVPESAPRRKKFADDNAYKTKPDIDFHDADDRRNGAWNDDF